MQDNSTNGTAGISSISGQKLRVSRYAIASLIISIVLLPSIGAPILYKVILFVLVLALAIKALIDVRAKKVKGKILSIIMIIWAVWQLALSILLFLKQGA
ncbi:MAG: hypothetical protein KGI45_01120 [Patescibacteria group bacterium]|nr:hypothetical protein [Patescibacteria group bacterium]MDE1941232.1 hypothetical protein [Patescibacteria group bacterium]MDE1966658.1 hypothetical protein [Patescibacteria group bacterium]